VTIGQATSEIRWRKERKERKEKKRKERNTSIKT